MNKTSETQSSIIGIHTYSAFHLGVEHSMALEKHPISRYSLSFLHWMKSSSSSPVHPSFSSPLAIRHFTACSIVPFLEIAHLECHPSLSRLAFSLLPLFVSPLPLNSEQYSIVWLCWCLFICSRTERCFDYWQVWVIESKAVINIHVQVFMWMFFRPFE